MAGKRNLTTPRRDPVHRDHEASNVRNDLESGNGNATAAAAKPRDRKYRFKDAGQLEPDDQRRAEFRDKLLHAMDGWDVQKCRKDDEQLKKIKSKPIRKFYELQNDRIADFIEVDAIVKAVSDDVLESFDPRDTNGDGVAEGGGALQDTDGEIEGFLPPDERERRQQAAKKARWAVNINVIANVILLTAKIVAVLTSGSLSLIASLVDSALDLLCTGIVFTTSKLVGWKIRKLRNKFPVGRRRLEPLGILVFSIIMIISFLKILEESFTKLKTGIEEGKGPKDAEALGYPAIGALAGTIIIKGIIGLGCMKIKTSQVQALAQDCKTDVIFNTLSLIFPAIGHAAGLWWLDPAGAGFLSLFIIFDWTSTMLEHVSRLSGAAVDDRVYEKLTFLAYRFSPLVVGFKNITAYHQGDGVWVEIDILLGEKTPLEVAHDIAETMQYCAEAMPEVDRAFVTCDYHIENPTGHSAESRGE